MASWSPSQSEPLTVSYMCQRQSSSPILPRAAATPPCAATVWLRVGKTLVMQAVFRPCGGAFQRGAQARAAGAHHHDIEGMIDDFISGHAVLSKRAYSAAMRIKREDAGGDDGDDHKAHQQHEEQSSCPAVWT